MKKLLTITIILIYSCSIPKRNWYYEGILTSIRIDDDAEYHFTTDVFTESDISKNCITIERKDIKNPELWFLKENSNNTHAVCGAIKFVLPLNYKIETFDD